MSLFLPVAQIDSSQLFWVWVASFCLVAMSLYLLARLAAQWQRETHLIPYTARPPVPWESMGAFLAILFTVTAIAAQFEPTPVAEPPQLREIAGRLASGAAQTLAICLVIAAALAMITRAKSVDFGLPQSLAELPRDIKLGVITWLASIVPVFGLHTLLIVTLKTPAAHPITDAFMNDDFANLSSNERLALVLAAFFSAVVVAPICEELAFRVMLQGWLEKHMSDDPMLPPAPLQPPMADKSESQNGNMSESVPSPPVAEPKTLSAIAAPSLLTGAILVSAFLFASAHLGHGPAPVPLFLLAIIYGYVYRCTHRIVPTIVAHGLFNATTLVALLISLADASQ